MKISEDEIRANSTFETRLAKRRREGWADDETEEFLKSKLAEYSKAGHEGLAARMRRFLHYLHHNTWEEVKEEKLKVEKKDKPGAVNEKKEVEVMDLIEDDEEDFLPLPRRDKGKGRAFEPAEQVVIDLISSDEDELMLRAESRRPVASSRKASSSKASSSKASNLAGPSRKPHRDEDEVMTRKKEKPRPAPPKRPIPTFTFLDLSIPASDLECSSSDDDQSSPSKPRSASPELYAPGLNPPRAPLTPATTPSPSGGTSPRRSGRSPAKTRHYGNVLTHSHAGFNMSGVPPPCGLRGKKRWREEDKAYRQYESGGTGEKRVKREKKPKEEDPEMTVPYVTPCIAHSLVRLYMPSMYRTNPSLTPSSMREANAADDAPLEEIKRKVERWQREDEKDCRTRGLSLPYNFRSGRVVTDWQADTFSEAEVGDEVIKSGAFVVVAGENNEPWFGRVEYFLNHPARADTQVHILWCSTAQALFEHAAHPRHLLLRDECSSIDASTIVCKVDVQLGTDKTVKAPAFFLSCLYHTNKSTSPVPALDGPFPYCENASNDVRGCWACEDALVHAATHGVDKKDGSAIPLPRWSSSSQEAFVYDGEEYHAGDYIYLLATEKAQQEAHWSGAQTPFRLARLDSLPSDKKLRPSTRLVVKPLLRAGHLFPVPDGERRKAREVVVTNETQQVELKSLMGHFKLVHGAEPDDLEPHQHVDTFFVNRYISESQDVETERAILSCWSASAPLLKPRCNLRIDLVPFVEELAGKDVQQCEKCVEQRDKEEQADEAYAEQLIDGKNKLVALSLFSGMDLFGSGLKKGFPELEIKAAVELDELAAKACKLDHPRTETLQQDVSVLLEQVRGAPEGDRLRTFLNDVDFVFGGPPCQAFSRANPFKKVDDVRLILVFVFLSFFESGRPLYGLMENVMGLASHKVKEKGDVFGLLCDLAIRLGYDIKPSVANASSFGVAQHRRRIFFELAKRGLPLPATPEPTHAISNNHARLGTKYGDEAKDEIKYIPQTKRTAVHSAPLPALTIKEAIGHLEPFEAFDTPVSAPNGVGKTAHSTHVTVGMTRKEQEYVPLVGIHGVDGKYGDWRDLDVPQPSHFGQRRVNKWRRLWNDEIVAVLLTEMKIQGDNGARLHMEQHRGLSVAECLILQGASTETKVFPANKDGDVLTRADVETAYKLIGNSVCVPVAAAHGRELRKVHKSLVFDNKRGMSGSSPGAVLSAQLDHRASSNSKAFTGGGRDGPALQLNHVQTAVEVIILDDSDDDDDDVADEHEEESQSRILDDAEVDSAGPFAGLSLAVDGDEDDEDSVLAPVEEKKKKGRKRE
ncbi:hypothetical protein JCM8547_007501 [Rhodosporidiobolus lusitaniae]